MKTKSCKDRIDSEKEDRIEQLSLLNNCASYPHHKGNIDEQLKKVGINLVEPYGEDEVLENVGDAIWNLPLDVEILKTYKILFSTGGPADWLEVKCTNDNPEWFDRGDVISIYYHFADWYDYASIELQDQDYETALDYVERLIPG